MFECELLCAGLSTSEGQIPYAFQYPVNMSQLGEVSVSDWEIPPGLIVCLAKGTQADMDSLEADPNITVLWSEPLPDLV